MNAVLVCLGLIVAYLAWPVSLLLVAAAWIPYGIHRWRDKHDKTAGKLWLAIATEMESVAFCVLLGVAPVISFKSLA